MAGPSPANPKPSGLAPGWLTGLALLLLLAVGLEHARHAIAVARFPYDLDNGEGFVLHQALVLSHGESPWQPIAREPYLVANFAPLYQAIVSLPMRFGAAPSFAWGRWLSVAALIGCAGAVAALVRRFSGGRLAPAVAALLFLSSKFVYDWSALHRVDALATALTLLGLVVVAYRGRVSGAALLFVLALVTRQTTSFAPLAAMIWLARGGHRGDAVRLGLLTFGGAGLLFLGLGAATGGEFLRHVLLYNVQPWSTALVGTFLEHWIWFHPALLALGLFYVASRSFRADLPTLYLVLTLGSLLLAGRDGAASNYMWELVAALSVASGIVLGDILSESPPPVRGLITGLLVVQAMVSHLAFQGHDVMPTPQAEDVARGADLARLVATAEGDVLCESAGYLVRAGKTVPYEPFLMGRLASSGRWDRSPMLENVASQRYSLVVLTFDPARTLSSRWDPALTDAIQRDYQRFRMIPGPGGGPRSEGPWWNYWVYVPKRRIAAGF